MSNIRTLMRSFGGGEVTPEFFGRIDDVKYQTGLATCRNAQILPHGPWQNRPGTRFVKEVKTSAKGTRVINFIYNTEQTFAVEMGEEYFRWHTSGATLEYSAGTAWSNVTAYVVGDIASRLGVNYYCILGHTNQQPPNATYWYPMPSDMTYEIPTPYQEEDLFDVHYVQSADVLTLVHPTYAPRELRREGATNWQLTTVSFVSDLSAPASIAATATVATGTGLASMYYTVTAVGDTGIEESLAGTADDCSNNLLTTGNYNTITWSAVSGASRYNVYKQDNGLYGYIGQTDALTFRDDNITADISKTPPIANNPFSGSGNYPAAVSYHEQRRWFAGTNNKPQTVWATRSGTESNLSYSIPTRDDDGISFRIAAREVNTIRHLVPLTSMVALTSSAEWEVTSVNSDAITPTSISVKPQSYIGASNVQPIIVNNNLIFPAARGGHMRELAYSWQANGYATGDLSLRAPHLFDGYEIEDMAYAKSPQPIIWAVSSSGDLLGLTYVPEQQIGAWHHHDTYTNAGSYDPLVGVTGGRKSYFESITVVPEGSEDAVYVVVRRVIDGSTVRYIERFASRQFDDLHDCYFVDSGVTYDDPKTITGITNADPGVVTAAGHGFNDGDYVDILEVEGMTEVNSLRFIVANKTANTFELTDEDGNDVDTSAYGTYTSGGEVRKAITTITSGIDHLEGEKVAALLNGAVSPLLTVTSGAVTFERASIVHLGLPIEADFKTLPLSFETQAFGQGRQKNVNKVWLRVNRSSGIFAGPTFDKLTEAKQRTTEPYGSPPALKSAEVPIMITPTWGDNGQVCVRQKDPLPLTITSMTLEVAVGG